MDITRRQFVIGAACTAACAACGSIVQAADAPAAAPIDVGTLADYPTDGPYDKFATSKKIMLVREGGKLFAESAQCTHKRYIISIQPAEGGQPASLVCNKHGSQFTLDGQVTQGPARRPLPRYGIKLDGGRVLVETSKTYTDKPDDPAASVPVKG